MVTGKYLFQLVLNQIVDSVKSPTVEETCNVRQQTREPQGRAKARSTLYEMPKFPSELVPSTLGKWVYQEMQLPNLSAKHLPWPLPRHLPPSPACRQRVSSHSAILPQSLLLMEFADPRPRNPRLFLQPQAFASDLDV